MNNKTISLRENIKLISIPQKGFRQKRLLDILISSGALLLVSHTVLAGTAIAITLENLFNPRSRGPIMFNQKRVGINGELFTIYKFRTLETFPSKKTGLQEVTKVGKVLRKTHIDELPQLFNVLRGNMSIVGPRPNPIEYDLLYSRIYPGWESRKSIHPGLTSPGSIINADKKHGDEQLEKDLEYIKNESAALYLRTILKTAFYMIKPRTHVTYFDLMVNKR